MQCINNLRQLGLSLSSYHATYESLPIGRQLSYDPRYTDPNAPCDSALRGPSFLVPLLPYLEQSNLYNQANQSLAIFSPENFTIQSCVVAALTCPSDFNSHDSSYDYPLSVVEADSPRSLVARSSYSGCMGTVQTWNQPVLGPNGCALDSTTPKADGTINDLSPIRFGFFTDGLSQTMVVAETETSSRTLVAGLSVGGWWFEGDVGQTLFTATAPPNAKRFVSPRSAERVWSASSLHPDGVNILLADGSARFIKDSVNCWPVVLSSGFPSNPKSPRGVWQALATRGGGEVISADDF
jgi:prepilin-type processing-associated H-X9-DG protein